MPPERCSRNASWISSLKREFLRARWLSIATNKVWTCHAQSALSMINEIRSKPISVGKCVPISHGRLQASHATSRYYTHLRPT